MKKISILGSTGKIGEVSLKILEKKKKILLSLYFIGLQKLQKNYLSN